MSKEYINRAGNSSIELSRSSTGTYRWSFKLYFMGYDLRSIRKMIVRIIKSKEQIESELGQTKGMTLEKNIDVSVNNKEK